jgi:hypothetical protein
LHHLGDQCAQFYASDKVGVPVFGWIGFSDQFRDSVNVVVIINRLNPIEWSPLDAG